MLKRYLVVSCLFLALGCGGGGGGGVSDSSPAFVLPSALPSSPNPGGQPPAPSPVNPGPTVPGEPQQPLPNPSLATSLLRSLTERSWAADRYVALSTSRRLTDRDRNDREDVYIRDLLLGTIDSPTVLGDGPSSGASISEDGRFVVFISAATNLTQGHTGQFADVFLWNRLSNKTVCLTEGANGDSFDATISADGEVIAFATRARLVALDTDNFSDIYLYTRRTGELRLLQGSADSDSVSPTLNSDGTLAAFVAKQFGYWQVFGWAKDENRVALLSRNSSNVAGNGDSFFPSLSDAGLLFSTRADNLIGSDANSSEDVMVLVGSQLSRAVENATKPVIARDSTQGLCIQSGSVLLVQLQSTPTVQNLGVGQEASLSRSRVLTRDDQQLRVDLPNQSISKVVNSTFQPSPAFDGPFFHNIGIANYGRPLYIDINSDERNDILSWADDEAGPRGFILATAQHDGTFLTEYFSIGGQIESYDTGDFNEDGNPDLVVTGYTGPYNSPVWFLRIYLGNGAGSFSLESSRDISRSSPVPVVGRFDPDEHLDVLLYSRVLQGSAAPPAPQILNGSGTGTLTDGATLPLNTVPGPPMVGDFNGDEVDDVAVLDNSNGEVSIMLNNGSGAALGSIQRVSVTTPGGFDFEEGVVVDIDLDDDLDLVVDVSGPTGESLRSQILVNTGGTFSLGDILPIYLSRFSGEDPVLSADFDGDGRDEVLLGIYLYSPDTGEVRQWTTSPQNAIAALDLNGDQLTDILFHHQTGVTFVAGNGDATFGPASATVPEFLALYGSVNGDFNNDLLIDIAADGHLLTGTQQKTFNSSTLELGPFAGAEDFDDDGNLDLVSMGRDSFTVSLGNGDGTFRAQSPHPAGRLWNIAPEIQDIDQDGHVDLFIIRLGVSLENSFEFWKGNGDGTFILTSAVEQRSSTNAIHLADVNNDGAVDLWVPDYILFASQPGVFNSPVERPNNFFLLDARFGDFDGDRQVEGFSFGDAYTAAADGLDVEPAPFVHEPSKLFRYVGQTESILTTLGEQRTGNQNGLSSVIPEDVDGDGDLDLQVLDSIGNFWLAVNNGDGTYSQQTPRHVLANLSRIQKLDYDFDGRFEKLFTGFGALFVP